MKAFHFNNEKYFHRFVQVNIGFSLTYLTVEACRIELRDWLFRSEVGKRSVSCKNSEKCTKREVLLSWARAELGNGRVGDTCEKDWVNRGLKK